MNYEYTGVVKIEPLVQDLRFIRNKKSWGYAFRFGLLEIREEDFQRILQEFGRSGRKHEGTGKFFQSTGDRLNSTIRDPGYQGNELYRAHRAGDSLSGQVSAGHLQWQILVPLTSALAVSWVR